MRVALTRGTFSDAMSLTQVITNVCLEKEQALMYFIGHAEGLFSIAFLPTLSHITIRSKQNSNIRFKPPSYFDFPGKTLGVFRKREERQIH